MRTFKIGKKTKISISFVVKAVTIYHIKLPLQTLSVIIARENAKDGLRFYIVEVNWLQIRYGKINVPELLSTMTK
jgi:hypothetical protein